MRGAQGGAPGSRFRARKLNTKTGLSILREADVAVDAAEHDQHHGTERSDAITSLPQVKSGVESHEEREHHLQAVINAARAASGVTGAKEEAQVSIPTPDAVVSSISYDRLFPAHFRQPHTYIRFSSTVEDSTGVPYCMNDEDDIFLKTFNAKRASGDQCSEDEFEQLMSSFEETTAARQPFAAVDNTPVLSLEEMELAFNQEERFVVSEGARKFARPVYEYWKGERAKKLNKSLVPKLKTLKMDSGQDADDSDPYVCFRRREVRQVRKTRGRDAQVVEKLKKLRKELEDARHLLHLVKQREYGRKEDLELSKTIFEQRASVREMKRTLDIRDDDEDLITQREPKRPKEMARPAGGRLPQKPVDRPSAHGAPETDLINFRHIILQREVEVTKFIAGNAASHERWNRDYDDRTPKHLGSVTSPEDHVVDPDTEPVMAAHVGIKAEYIQQPTPPASVDSHDDDDDEAAQPERQSNDVSVRFARASEHKNFAAQTRCRMRVGRGGRQMIDRVDSRRAKERQLGDRERDLFKYDRDDGQSSSDEEIDTYSSKSISYRTQWGLRTHPQDHSEQQQAQAQAHMQAQLQAQRRAQAAAVAAGQAQGPAPVAPVVAR